MMSLTPDGYFILFALLLQHAKEKNRAEKLDKGYIFMLPF